LLRVILDTLRKAGEPLSEWELAKRIAPVRNVDKKDHHESRIRKNVPMGSSLYIGLLTSILAAMAYGDVPVKWLIVAAFFAGVLRIYLRYLWHHQRGRIQARPKLVCLLPNTANLIVNLTSSPCYIILHNTRIG